jgi:hypothetical protein
MGSTAGLVQLLGTGAKAGATAYSAYNQANALKSQGDYARVMGNLNANMADIQSQDAIDRGEEEAKRLGIQTRQLIGQQRASAAAQGVQVNSGSPLNLQTDAAALSALDQATIRHNAWNEAMGLRMESSSLRSRAEMAGRTGRYNARNTLLAGGMNALGTVGSGLYSYYRYTPPMQVPQTTYDPLGQEDPNNV